MSRKIPTQVQLNIDSNASTLTRLLRVILASGTTYGICMTNRDVVYDHGDGEVTYVAANGFDPSTIASDISYSVGNAEGYALISEDVPGVTEEMVNTGQLDGAKWVCYYVDYEKPDLGSAVILDAGDVGAVVVDHGLLWIPELLSYIVRLKQPVGDVWSRACRAEYGSPAASQRGCGVDVSGLWQNFTVDSLGQESDRTFYTSGLVEDPTRPFNPGRVEWLTGKNAGKVMAVELFVEDTSGTQLVSLFETTPYDIAPTDTGRIRNDCAKTVEACKANNNYLNMKAEPLIPVGDTAAIQIPGAQT